MDDHDHVEEGHSHQRHRLGTMQDHDHDHGDGGHSHQRHRLGSCSQRHRIGSFGGHKLLKPQLTDPLHRKRSVNHRHNRFIDNTEL